MDMIGLTVGIVGLVLGVLSVIAARSSLTNFCRSIRPREFVAIFGPQSAGKTTLVRYLQGKRLPDEHIATFGIQRVGKIVLDLSGNETFFFRSREMFDVAGEHKEQWAAIIEAENPDGIIYILDTTEPKAELAGLLDILAVYRMASLKSFAVPKLRVLLILLNKCNRWGKSEAERSEGIRNYRESVLRDALEAFRRELPHVQIQFGASSLIDTEYFTVTNYVLRVFALAMLRKD